MLKFMLKEALLEGADWIQLAQDKHGQSLANTVMNLWVS
jgi:hypothetical protein